jgi:hypothetical protein
MRKALFGAYMLLIAWPVHETLGCCLRECSEGDGAGAFIALSVVAVPWSALLAFLSPLFLVVTFALGPAAFMAMYILTWGGIVVNAVFLYRWAFHPTAPRCDL